MEEKEKVEGLSKEMHRTSFSRRDGSWHCCDAHSWMYCKKREIRIRSQLSGEGHRLNQISHGCRPLYEYTILQISNERLSVWQGCEVPAGGPVCLCYATKKLS